MKLVQAHIDEELYTKFRIKLIKEDKTIKEVLVELIKLYIEEG